MAHGDKDLKLDIENEPITGEEEEYQNRNPILGLKNMAELLLAKARGSFTQGSSDDGVSLSSDASNSGSVYAKNMQAMTSMNVVGHDHNIKDDGKENKLVKEKCKSLSNKKSPKPPRPPRSPSLDAADPKLIQELSELARLKRARIKRMKALKNMKITKGTPPPSRNMLALLFTILFCIVIIFQGMPSKGTPMASQGSHVPVRATERAPTSVSFLRNPVVRNNYCGKTVLIWIRKRISHFYFCCAV
ncbi:hypothetical protein ES332_A10G207600v1 [Gossypium tomentosum]|uniref:Uncharacterized protein n=1 Tax=Gossypium tomentosum TaxID=34277 RepID=A0A5D2NVQ8_GOSTO|nr:hypothetical protein ES332_A10G207600v1 [Gossypium tomentosum]TYI07155.1 hypothetical protein ES332_A10G207600v1 [Gossypium tomentosum]